MANLGLDDNEAIAPEQSADSFARAHDSPTFKHSDDIKSSSDAADATISSDSAQNIETSTTDDVPQMPDFRMILGDTDHRSGHWLPVSVSGTTTEISQSGDMHNVTWMRLTDQAYTCKPSEADLKAAELLKQSFGSWPYQKLYEDCFGAVTRFLRIGPWCTALRPR
ncbi:unnamed protein product [Protopolystoma xenopodis]|uniref:Uncharacterized protein n=1 Tax=Protopolystoma xenopodis TaxID=117903 RepID=A0A3S5BD60_9PLAT|nr:unnamed protein product [Protopolystoma xenopodis]